MKRKLFLFLAISLGLFVVYALILLIAVPDSISPAYYYETTDYGFLVIESPGKGPTTFQTAQAAFLRYRDWRGDPTMVLYRTTKPDYLNPWRWYDIATSPRWKLPYLEPPPRDTTKYWETIQSNQNAAWEYSRLNRK